MNFCSRCGANTEVRIPRGDNRPRDVCRSCRHIFYENPRVVTGCLVVSDEQVLLCKRGIRPRRGLWTLPAGFLEKGETSKDGAIRETQEEAQASVSVQMLYTQFDLAYISQIYQFYLARLDGSFGAGSETTDVQLFEVADIPWDELAFAVVERTLRCYINDRVSEDFQFRQFELQRRRDWSRSTSIP